MKTPRAAMPFAVAMAAVAGVYLLRLDGVVGLLVDDAWYLVLAQALANGDGYRLISSATTPILPTVPPGFPLLLAPVVAAVPHFPDYVIWTKLVSIVCVFAAGILCWRDFTRHRGVPPVEATLIVCAAWLTPALVFLATSTVMSESPYLLAQVAAVIAVERVARAPAGDHRSAIAAGVLTGVAMLIRTSAAALVAAALAYLVIRRQWRQASVVAVAIGLTLAPWMVYSAVHAPTNEARAAHGGSIAYSYSQLLTTSQYVFADPSHGSASVRSLLERCAQNLEVVVSRDVGAMLAPVLYRGPEESGQEVYSIGRAGMGDMGVASGTMVLSIAVGMIILVGWLGTRSERFAMPGLLLAATLPMIAPVVGQTFRYLVPLAPYLVLFFWRGLRAPAVARAALMIVIGLHGLDHGRYIHQKLTADTEWLADWREHQELLAWISGNLSEGQAVAR
jgi:hypothetical protein